MTLILSGFCVFLVVFHGVDGNVDERVIKENDRVTISCKRENPGILFWLRAKENGQGLEYVASYSRAKKGKVAYEKKFTVNEESFEIISFEQESDSGTYSCVSINNNALQFSGTTKLRGEKIPTVKPMVQTTTTQTQTITTKAVVKCGQNSIISSAGKKAEKIDVLLGCEMHIFIPLVAGSGLLLLLLIITILYCNSIRTRRCPHHYKRQPRGRPAGHKSLPNPPDY